jgi:hypothetical protein
MTTFVIIEVVAIGAMFYVASTSNTKLPELLVIRVATFILLLPVAFTIYILTARRAREFEVAGESKPVASSLKTGRLCD